MIRLKKFTRDASGLLKIFFVKILAPSINIFVRSKNKWEIDMNIIKYYC